MGPTYTWFFERAMGFRAVSDLSDYSISELLALIEHATKVLREKISGTARSSSPGASSSGVSVIEPEAAASFYSDPQEFSGSQESIHVWFSLQILRDTVLQAGSP